MKKYTFINIFAFVIGIYFIIRSYFWYSNDTGDTEQNHFFALVYFCVGIFAILLQLIVNYIKNKKKK